MRHVAIPAGTAGIAVVVLALGLGAGVLAQQPAAVASAASAKAAGQRVAAANRKPHIDKVFEILKALPDMTVFANEAELDDYLTAMQERARGD